MDSRKIALVSLFGALSAALEMIPGIPMPGAEFLKFDIAEAPVLVLTLILDVYWGLLSVRGLALAIVAVKGDPLGMVYKVVAAASQVVFLYLLRDRPLPRLSSSFLRAAFMTFFDRATIPLVRGVPVGIKLASVIFLFNLVQGAINSSVAIYAYRVAEESELLCTLGLRTCGQDMEESGF